MDANPLPNDIDTCHATINELREQLEALQRENEQMAQRLDQLLRTLYGRRSERLDPNQLPLFLNETPEQPSETGGDALAPETETITYKRQKPNGRRPIPEDLPRYEQIHDLPDEEKPCPGCGTQREVINVEVSEQLDYQPASFWVTQHRRLVYGCRTCEGHMAQADKPPQPIEKGLPGPGLAAQIVTHKYADHVPLYRQEEIYARSGVLLARSTMCDWCAEIAGLLWPLYDLMHQQILQSKMIQTDDTPVRVLAPKQGQTEQGHIWVYLGDQNHPFTVFDFTAGRSRDGPIAFLTGFQGYLQADAFAGYDAIFDGGAFAKIGEVVEVGCWAHARRKFYDARAVDVVHAPLILGYIRQLYGIEREARAQQLDAAHRYELRQEKAKPVLAELNQKLQEARTQVLPKSPTGAAIEYTLANWDALNRYIQDGDLEIDNNASERALRAIAVGRKNWLFKGSRNGGQTGAVLASFTATCKRHGIDPFIYLRDVIARIAEHPVSRLHELLVDQWQPVYQPPTAPAISAD